MDGRPYDEFVGVDDYDMGYSPPEVPRLVDLLPPLVKKLQILASPLAGHMDIVQSLFIDFVTERGTGLPSLTSVTIDLDGIGDWWSRPAYISSLQQSEEVDVVTRSENWQREYEDAFMKRFGFTS